MTLGYIHAASLRDRKLTVLAAYDSQITQETRIHEISSSHVAGFHCFTTNSGLFAFYTLTLRTEHNKAGGVAGSLGAPRMRKNEAHSCDLTHHQNGSEGNASEPYKSHVSDPTDVSNATGE